MKKLLLLVAVFATAMACAPQPEVYLKLAEKSMAMGMAECRDKLVIADTQHNYVQIFSKERQLVRSIPGFEHPMDVACTNSEIFVAEFQADQISVLDYQGKIMRKFGTTGVSPGQFKAPAGLAIKGNKLYVAEFYGNRVQKLTLHGKPLGQVAEKFTYPTGLGFYNGRLYVADSYAHRIAIFEQDKLVSQLTKKKYGFKVVTDVKASAKGIFIADSGNFRIVKIDSDKIETIFHHKEKPKRYSPSRLLLANHEILILDNALERVLSAKVN